MTETTSLPDITGLNDLVAAELRSIAARRDVSHSALAERLGVTQMWLSRRMRGITGLSVDDLAAICSALDVEPVDVIDAANRHS